MISGSGIVIRSYLPEQARCVVFDCARGSLMMSVVQRRHAQKIVHGALLEYTFDPRCRRDQLFLRCSDIRLIAMPEPWVTSDIRFFHHFLEMSEVFLSANQAMPVLSELFTRLYLPPDHLVDEGALRLWFLAAFFLHVGIYPDDEGLGCSCHGYHHPISLISRTQDTMVMIRGCSAYRGALYRWLRSCVALHPLAHCFKTVGFLDVMDDQ